MEQALVSIIIPIYNVEAYLDKCVESACKQTYTNLEIILVDDGSPDGCPQKCDEWAARDSRIKVIHKPNGGLSDARNAGLDIATGKYICFLDSDDYIEPNMVEVVSSHMEEEVDLVVFQHYKEVPDGSFSISKHHVGEYFLRNGKEKVSFILGKLLQYQIGWEAWNKIYRRDLIEIIKLRFADNRRIFAEDMFFSLCYCAHASNVRCIVDSLYHYVIRDGSIMSTNKTKLTVGRMNELAKDVKKFFQSSGADPELISAFPGIFALIINNALRNAEKGGLYLNKATRTQFVNDISNVVFFRSQAKLALRNKRLISAYMTKFRRDEMFSYLRFLLDGSYWGLRIRNRMIHRFSKRVSNFEEKQNIKRKLNRESGAKESKVFLIGTEDFGNLGDHQIAEAIVSFISNQCEMVRVVEIPCSQYKTAKQLLKKRISSKDVIILPGGGNFGDVYPVAQNLRQDVIETWRLNPKIIFPQTIFFSDSEEGISALEKAKTIYTKENNVYLFAREKTSYMFAQKYFSCKTFLVPDIVLSVDKQVNIPRKNIALLCMRSDQEKQACAVVPEKALLGYGLHLRCIDHQLSYSISFDKRTEKLKWIMEYYHMAKIVVTDRLHGMIFAAITGTPCIAFGNYNHKVKGTYEWIRYLPYVRYVESVEEAEKLIPELLNMRECHYDPTPLQPYFEELARVVKQYANN